MTRLIAEIGGNHGGCVDKCISLAKAAHLAGADAVKFQALGLGALVSKYKSPERFDHFRKLEFSLAQWLEILSELKQIPGFNPFFSVWDPTWIEQLDKHVSEWKVGSGDLTNRPMLAKLIDTGKKLLISTAMANESEVRQAIDFCLKLGLSASDLTVFECKANYDDPTRTDLAFGFIEKIGNDYGCNIGYSHHGTDLALINTCIAREYSAVEFHFTNDQSDSSFRDHKLSLSASDLEAVVDYRRLCRSIISNQSKTLNDLEKKERPKFRRGSYASRNLKRGEKLSIDDVNNLRPLEGIGAEDISDFYGRQLTESIQSGHPISSEHFK